MNRSLYRVVVLLILASLPFATVAGQVVPAQIPTNGLVGWWPFDANANDGSGNEHHGVVNGATLTADRFGNPNSAYSFNGESAYIATTLDRINTNELTISAWVKLAWPWPTDNTGPIVTSRGSGHADGIYLSNNQSVQNDLHAVFTLTVTRCNEAFHNVYTNRDVDDQRWYHFVGVYDGTYLHGYIDGVKYGSQYQNLEFCIDAAFDIGRDSIGWYFHGQIDDVAIWDRALSDEEILTLFEGPAVVTMRSDTLAVGSSSSVTKLRGPSTGTYQYTLPSASGTLALSLADPMPFGTVTLYAGSAPPSGYLECNGQVVSRATYPSLFAVIGTEYGPGDGVTTFGLPKLTHAVLRYGIRAQ